MKINRTKSIEPGSAGHHHVLADHAYHVGSYLQMMGTQKTWWYGRNWMVALPAEAEWRALSK